MRRITIVTCCQQSLMILDLLKLLTNKLNKKLLYKQNPETGTKMFRYLVEPPPCCQHQRSRVFKLKFVREFSLGFIELKM